MRTSLALGLVLCLLSTASATPPAPVPLTVSRQGHTLAGQLELSRSGTSVDVRWTLAGTTWRASCAEVGRPDLERQRRRYLGTCRPVVRAGMAAALAPTEVAISATWTLSLVVEGARGLVRGTVFSSHTRFSPPSVEHTFSGLLPIRVGDRWLPRLQPGPQPAGWLDGLTANDPYTPTPHEGLPLPAPSQRALGRLVVLVPGMFNMPPSRDLVVRLARHADTVVIAYCNPYPRRRARVHRVTHLDDRALPRELRGRILAHGDPSPLINAYPQASDRVLQVLHALRESRLFTGDPLQARATLVGHCQGALATLLTRERLRAAGFPDAVGLTVGLAPPYRGLSVAESGVVRWLARRVSLFAPGLANALEELRPNAVRARVGDAKLDVVVTGFGQDSPESDGLVPVSTARLAGLRFRALAGYDHAQIFQRPAVVDQAVRTLRE
jgi:hypothetical protein